MVKSRLERTVGITLLSLLTVITAILIGVSILQDDPPLRITAVTGATFVFAGLLIAYLRGWNSAPLIVAALITILPVIVLDSLNPAAALACLVAPTITIVFARAQWVLLSGLITIGGIGLKDILADFSVDNLDFFVIGFLIVTTMAAARLVMDEARDQALHQAAEAEQARQRAEAANAESHASNQLLLQQTAQQQQLIELLNNLEVPAITLYENVLFIPVVGALDTRRAKRLMTEALESVHSRRAKMLILDIAGMPLIDTASARALTQAVEAVKLLGCTVIISGLRHDVALMLAEIQSEMPNVQFVQSLEDVFKQIMPNQAEAKAVR
ncbi:MAG: STAS domain-containing protein [Oscillochloridaceae bacterium umkhey_bin13]